MRMPARSRSADALEQVQLEPFADRWPLIRISFSGGQRQRVMIAMALLCGPPN